jgi:hypothetical protein
MAWNEEDETDPEPDPEAPDAADMSDEPATIECPYCHREVLEDSIGCPHCGNYLSRESDPKPREWWWIVAMILVILLLLTYLIKW